MRIIILFVLVLSAFGALGQTKRGQNRPCSEDTVTIDYTTPCSPSCDSSYLDTGIVIINEDCWQVNYRPLKNGTYKTYKITVEGRLTLFEVVTYKHNRPSGSWLSYHESGNLSHLTSYKRGVPDGVSLSYNEKGVLCSVYFINLYNEHEISGTFSQYWETGVLAHVWLVHKHEIISEAFFDKEGKSVSKEDFYQKWNDCSY